MVVSGPNFLLFLEGSYYTMLQTDQQKLFDSGCACCYSHHSYYRRYLEAMEIQIASDLHLEYYCVDYLNFINNIIFDEQLITLTEEITSMREAEYWKDKCILQPTAPTLALLGDISTCTTFEGKAILESFLRFYSSSYERILYISGNHEYYCASQCVGGHMMVDIVDTVMVDIYLQSLSEQISKFHYLNQTRIDVDGVAILGCTLWSAIPDTNPRIQMIVESFLNDYRQIYVVDEEVMEYRIISGDDTNSWFRRHVKWIEEQLAGIERDEPNTPVIVLTHHGPTLKGCSNPRYENQSPPKLYRRHGFVSDLLPLLHAYPNLKAWFYGHTHYNNTRILSNGVLLSCNQRGYPDHILHDYRPADSFEVNVHVSNKKKRLENENEINEDGQHKKDL